MVNVLETLPPTESVTLKVIEERPVVVVGVPVIVPDDKFNDNPLGSNPEVIDHKSGDEPPVTPRVCE